jgi:hypothetical protein
MSVNPQLPGSTRVPRVGERVLAIADFSWTFVITPRILMHNQSSFRHDAETNTRDACAPQIP